MARRMVRGVLAAAALTLFAGTAATGTAFAQASGTHQVNGTSQASSAPATIQAVYTGHGKSAGRIVCAAAVSKPRFFLPNHKSIATVGVISCSSRVAGIAGTVIITKDNRPVKKKGFANLAKKRAQAVATYKCATSRTFKYNGVLLGTVVFPPGFTPHIGHLAALSSAAHLRCRG